MRRFALSALAIPLLIILFAVDSHSDPIGFLFNPPAVSYSTTREVTTTTTLDRTKKMEMGVTVVAKNRLQPRDAGYELSVEPGTVTVTRGGAPTDNPVLQVIKGMPYRLLINAAGEVTEVDGFTDLPEKLKSVMTEAMAARALQRMSADQLRQEVQSEWNGLVGFRRSGAAEVGEIVFDRRRQGQNRNSRTIIYSASIIKDTVLIDGRQCARMVITACNDPEELADSLGLTRAKIMEIFALTDQVLSQVDESSEDMVSVADLTFELKTGLMHSVRTSMRTTRTLTSGGNTGVAEVSEVERVTYDYTARGDS